MHQKMRLVPAPLKQETFNKSFHACNFFFQLFLQVRPESLHSKHVHAPSRHFAQNATIPWGSPLWYQQILNVDSIIENLL